MNNKQDSVYYVYLLLDPRKLYSETKTNFGIKQQPFYVGMGKNDRCHYHTMATKMGLDLKNPRKFRTIKNILSEDLEPIVFLAYKQLSREDALSKEKGLVTLFGRSKKIDGKHIKGILTNLTDGGDYNPMFDEEIKERVRSHHIGAKRTEESRKKMSIAAKNKDKQLIENSVKAMHKTLPGNKNGAKKVECINIETNEKIIFSSYKEAGEFLKVGYEPISRCANGITKRGHVKGWLCKNV